MKKINTLLLVLALFFMLDTETSIAQIWEPEGINMPGAWNSWTNPPDNNLALASFTQVTVWFGYKSNKWNRCSLDYNASCSRVGRRYCWWKL
jgi:hypothetical protein